MNTVASVIVFCVLAVAAQALTLEEGRVAFGNWAVKHKKTYGTEAEADRALKAFMENDERIRRMEEIDPTAIHGHNQYSDMTSEEFRAFYTLPTGYPSVVPSDSPVWTPTTEAIPEKFDWREDKRTVVGPVKNQGQCGSCWTFSGTFAMEAAWVLAGNEHVSLSEQQIVDCDHETVKYEGQDVQMAGCQGGFPWSVYNYTKDAGGQESETSYPYMAVDQQCAFDAKKAAVPGPKSWEFITTTMNEDEMAQYMATVGPIAIAVDATYMQTYIGGISNPLLCSKTHLDHAVALVGYGKGKNLLGHEEEYWILRNSWGASWGEKGYMKIKKGKNVCGLANVPSAAKF